MFPIIIKFLDSSLSIYFIADKVGSDVSALEITRSHFLKTSRDVSAVIFMYHPGTNINLTISNCLFYYPLNVLSYHSLNAAIIDSKFVNISENPAMEFMYGNTSGTHSLLLQNVLLACWQWPCQFDCERTNDVNNSKFDNNHGDECGVMTIWNSHLFFVGKNVFRLLYFSHCWYKPQRFSYSVCSQSQWGSLWRLSTWSQSGYRQL